MWLTHSGCTHGKQQKLNGDKQGDEKREKRHFQLECNLSDFLLLFTIEMQLPDASRQPLCIYHCCVSLPMLLEKGGLYLLWTWLVFKVPVARQQWLNGREERR